MKSSFLSTLSLPGFVQALLAALLFGASTPFSKLLLGSVDPILLAGLLYLGSGIGSWMLYLLTHKRSLESNAPTNRLNRQDAPWLLGAIVTGGIAAPILLMVSLAKTPASTASLLINFESVATALIAFLVFREAAGKRIYWAIALITAAAILLSWTSGNWGFSLGALGVLAACFFWGLDNNFTRKISSKNPMVIVGIKGMAAGTFSFLLALSLGNPLPSLGVIALALLLGAVCYGLSIQLFIMAMRSLGAARTSTLFGTAPFVGTFLSFLLLKEIPAILFWVALPLMLAGAWLMVSENHQHSHIHEAASHSHPHTHPDVHHEHDHPGLAMPFIGSHTHPHSHPP